MLPPQALVMLVGPQNLMSNDHLHCNFSYCGGLGGVVN
jgi:hypothetical protein